MGHSPTTNPNSPCPALAAPPPASSRRFDPRRVYTAVILIPVIYAVIRYLPPWGVTVILLVVGSIALMELYRLAFLSCPNHLLTGVGLVVSTLVIARHHLSVTLADLLLISALALLVILPFSSGPVEHRLKNSSITALGVFYVGFTLSTLVSTRSLPSGELLVFFVVLVTWAGDTGAYYVGTLWGRHLLAPTISPKKTVEGVVGGLTLAVGAALVAHAWFFHQFSLLDTLFLGFLLGGAGLLGDLCESAIKRRVGAKDSGGILPGHGGMLDRLDSLLFTGPTFYYYVTCVRGISLHP